MASCTQIETMIQAWIDGELAESEQDVLERHVSGCRACRCVVDRQRRASGYVSEALAERRLRRGLRSAVLDNLPEMAPPRNTGEASGWSHPDRPRRTGLLTRMVPALAAAVVMALASLLYFQWPHEGPQSNAVGVVAHQSGHVTVGADRETSARATNVKDYVLAGQCFRTNREARVMVALRGPTLLKADQGSEFVVYNDRQVAVNAGRVCLDVGHDERLFRVITPGGQITVFGTLFGVTVEGERTVVTVERGKVRVENGEKAAEVEPGQQVAIAKSSDPLLPVVADVRREMSWAENISADPDAYALFSETIQPRTVAELPAEQYFVMTPNDASVTAFALAWEPDGWNSDHCGYDVHVYDGAMKEVFREHVAGRVFDEPASFAVPVAEGSANGHASRCVYEVCVPGQAIRGADVIHIKMVPDVTEGHVKTSLTVTALGI